MGHRDNRRAGPETGPAKALRPRQPGRGAVRPPRASTARASSRLHPGPQQHPGPREDPEACECRLPGSAAGPGQGPRLPQGPAPGRRMLCPARLCRPLLGPPLVPPLARRDSSLVARPCPSAGAAVTQRAGNGCGEGLLGHPLCGQRTQATRGGLREPLSVQAGRPGAAGCPAPTLERSWHSPPMLGTRTCGPEDSQHWSHVIPTCSFIDSGVMDHLFHSKPRAKSLVLSGAALLEFIVCEEDWCQSS